MNQTILLSSTMSVCMICGSMCRGLGVHVQDYQVDWEAILQRTPEEFIASLSSWFLPEEARPSSSKQEASDGEPGASASGTQVRHAAHLSF